MSEKPNALELADKLDSDRAWLHKRGMHQQSMAEAAFTLRTQHAELEALRAEVERLREDAARLGYLEREANELRTAETGEDDFDWVVISRHMDRPYEREVGRARTPRGAIDAAREAQK